MAEFFSSPSRKENQADIMETVNRFLSVMPPGSEISLTVRFSPFSRLSTAGKSKQRVVQEQVLKDKESEEKSSFGSSSSQKRRNKKEKRMKRERKMLQRKDSNSSMGHRIQATEPDIISDYSRQLHGFERKISEMKSKHDKIIRSMRSFPIGKDSYPCKSKTDAVPLTELRNPQESMMPRKNEGATGATTKSGNESNYEQIDKLV